MQKSYQRIKMPNINTTLARQKLIKFIKNEVDKSPYGKCIMGISGGVDSAVVASLACKAVGSENLIGLLMPYKTSTSDVVEDAKLVSKNLKITTLELDISPQIDAFIANHPHDDLRRLGSKMVRERSALLYYYADMYQAAVVGTANKSEIWLGYFTKWGDPAADLLPLSRIYKTHVLQLARLIGVPSKIIEKSPSAGMWPGQKDEDEFGFTYKEADPILYYLVDLSYSPEKLKKMGCHSLLVDKVAKKVADNEFKRKPQLKPTLPKEIFNRAKDYL